MTESSQHSRRSPRSPRTQHSRYSPYAPHPTPEPFADELDIPFADGEYEDGNALAGPLSEIFAVDLTAAEGRCTGCGATGPIARLHVYGPAPGLVARCPDCGQVVLRLVRGTDSAWLDLRGAVSLRIRIEG
jgi:hypothetical protein